MSYFPNADEVFAIGIEIEKNGQAFYSIAAENTVLPEARRLFQELADWEGRHIKIFESLRKGITGEKTSDVFDPDDELAAYLKAAAENHVFVGGYDGAKAASDCKTPKEVLAKAIQFEKDSVVYYSAMQRVVPESMGNTDISNLISEELKHIAILTKKAREIG